MYRRLYLAGCVFPLSLHTTSSCVHIARLNRSEESSHPQISVVPKKLQDDTFW